MRHFSISFYDFSFVLPEIFLFTSTLILFTYLIAASSIFKNRDSEFAASGSYLAALILGCFILLMILQHSSLNISQEIFGGIYIVDYFSSYLKILVAFTALVTTLFFGSYNKYGNIDNWEFPIIVLLATLGMIGLISCNDFILFYLLIELISLSLYILVSFKVNNPYSTEAGFKYFILGAFSSCLLLFGISIIYATTGLTLFTELSMDLQYMLIEDVPVDYMILLGATLVLSSLLFKLAASPFHAWAPDVYDGSPTIVTVFVSTGPKVAIIGSLVRILSVFYALHMYWQYILVFAGVLSITVGTFSALGQTKLKRLFAYSSISHIGYILLGLSCYSLYSITVVIMYVTIYIITTIAWFTILLSLRSELKRAFFISEIRSLGVTNPALALALSIVLFSMSGIPPLAGFYGKYFIFTLLMAHGHLYIGVYVIICSVITSVLYIRIIKDIFFTKSIEIWSWDPVDLCKAIVLGSIVSVLGLFFIFQYYILILCGYTSLATWISIAYFVL